MEPLGGAATRKQTQDLPTHTVSKVTEKAQRLLSSILPNQNIRGGKKKKNSLKEEKRDKRGKVIESSDYESQL